MTNEEVIKHIGCIFNDAHNGYQQHLAMGGNEDTYHEEYIDALSMVIEALEKQSHICSNCTYFKKDWIYACTEVHLCTKHYIARYGNAFCSDWEDKND